MRPDGIEGAAEVVEVTLLGTEVGLRRSSGFALEGSVHAFVTAILLRLTRLDGLRTDAEPDPPSAEACEPSEADGSEGRAVAEYHLREAISFFGEDRDVTSLTTAEVQKYANHLQTVSNGRGGTLSAGSQRHYLNSLSNLFRRAQSEGVVTPGYNPVAALMEKPSGKPAEARWLELHDAALLLESARTYRPHPDAHAGPIYPLLAVLLLTGGRTSEVLGLEVDDVSFQRQTITFRPNEWRRLKTLTSHRSVPLWPQAESVLRAYFADKERDGGLGRLLFPSPVSHSESLITDFRKALDVVAGRAGWERGEIRSKMFRHTYCSARLQTLDGGAPVSPYTVGKELGHGGTSMVERVYSHLGQVRHRSDVVEYRLEDHREALGERLAALEKASV